MNKKRIAVLAFFIFGFFLIGLLFWKFPYVLESKDNVASVIWSVILLCALIPAGVHHLGSAQALKYAATWMGIILVILVGYSFHEDLSAVGKRLKENLIPSSASLNEDGSVSFRRALNGHFMINASVNQIPIHFMVDTGATQVSLTLSDAKRLGVDIEKLSYTIPLQTANGLVYGAPITIDELKIDTIRVQNISATVSKNLGDHSLLGMSFIKKLKGFKIEGSRLTLEPYSN